MADVVTRSEGTEVIVAAGAGFKLRTRRLHLEIIDGPDAGLAVVLPGPEVRIGTGTECHLALGDRAVSRHHATLWLEPHGVRLVDAGSRNGTQVDGLRVQEAYPRPDSVLVMGRTALRLKLVSDLVDLPPSRRTSYGALLGGSPVMRQVFAVLERVAPTETTVLVEGETGTGKELVAEAIHDESRRADGPFVVLDCSAVSPGLFESELFGHVRGAFTGAVADRIGALAAADGGTLFLDEIGELPLDLQPKLLRALERLEVRPVGASETRTVDVRIIAATNRNLAHEVEQGRFRSDLYYRLAVVRITMPPLRERAADIRVLVDRFTGQFQVRHAGAGPLPEHTLAGFETMAWPGNVRELRNAVARALSVGPPADLVADGQDPRRPAALPVDLTVPFLVARDAMVAALERAYFAAALDQAEGNVTRAAELAGVNRKFVYRVIDRHHLRGGDGDTGGAADQRDAADGAEVAP